MMTKLAKLAVAAPLLRRLAPTLLLFGALEVLRIQVLSDLGLPLREAWAAGLGAGIACDLMAALLPAFVARLVRAATGSGRGSSVSWIVVAFFVWLALVANALYFRFFGMPLDWWVVRLHWRDLRDVIGAVPSLSSSASFVASAAVLAAALVSSVRYGPGDISICGGAVSEAAVRQLRRRTFGGAMLLGVAGAVLWEAPAMVSINDGSPLVKDNIIRLWLMQNFHHGLYQGVGMRWTSSLDGRRDAEDVRAPTRWLAAYREFDGDPLLAAAHGSHALEPGPWRDRSDYPLVHELRPDSSETRQWRAQVGLPPDGPVHVVILFVESLRAFEFEHPQLASVIFPRLHGLLARHGLHFTPAYSSSRQAGQTVRGFFSTLCSSLPNMGGPAEYLAFTTLRVTCLQQILKQEGYRTTHMNSYRASFHQARLFEGLHGTDEFYDEEYYRGLGITQRIGDWGYADRPFLLASLELMQKLAADGRPLFVSASTLSTHYDYSVIPEGPLPDWLMRDTARFPEYQGFLSRLRYADNAVADFIEALFAGPLGERTVVVVLGDHSVGLPPHYSLAQLQREDLLFRITLALFTKHMPEPGVRHVLAHQVDVAPTVAAIVGARGEVAWVGRNLLAGEGSPWLYAAGGDNLQYRTSSRYCMRTGRRRLSCFDAREHDPLLEPSLPPAPVLPDEAELFARVALSNLVAMAENRIMPPPARKKAQLITDGEEQEEVRDRSRSSTAAARNK